MRSDDRIVAVLKRGDNELRAAMVFLAVLAYPEVTGEARRWGPLPDALSAAEDEVRAMQHDVEGVTFVNDSSAPTTSIECGACQR